ncbi:MAG: hypothetical protein GY841_03820 [FCB group bacterium]|nr:hypothetical protein [FCB group bacterium]
MKEVVNREQAEVEYELFLEHNYLKRDFVTDEVEGRDAERDKQIIVSAVVRGALVFNDGVPTYTPETSDNKDPIVFYKPKGDVLAAMDKRKDHQKVSQMYAAMGQLTKTSAVKFAKMDHRPDLELCMTLFSAFLA